MDDLEEELELARADREKSRQEKEAAGQERAAERAEKMSRQSQRDEGLRLARNGEPG